jgi:predicted ATPase
LAGRPPGDAQRAAPLPPVSGAAAASAAPLPAVSRRLLEVAAVAGRDFDLAPLAAVLGEPPDAVLAALAPALSAGIVREMGGPCSVTASRTR